MDYTCVLTTPLLGEYREEELPSIPKSGVIWGSPYAVKQLYNLYYAAAVERKWKS